MPRTLIAPARERILATASLLFYRQGINRTGIDQIIAESGVAKASFYHSFRSKELLIVEYLTTEAAAATEFLSGKAGVMAPFDFLEMTIRRGEFMGCPFANALAELPHSVLIAEAVTAYRKTISDYFSAQVTSAGATRQLMLLYDGAFLACKLDKPAEVLNAARALVERIMSVEPTLR
jgi:AcrR family transcriptional regulator